MEPGHETTTGMLSFLFVLLLKDPQRLSIAQDEVGQVVGRRTTHR